MAIAYLALGSNLGDRAANIETALDHLRGAGVVVEAVSDLIETVPSGGPSQPPFLNGAARIRTDLTPGDLLALLKEAERAAGREDHGVRWGPREADLDLLLYGDETIETEELTVPHPRMRERMFVLDPLTEVALEDARDPETGRTVFELRDELVRRRAGERTVRVAETVDELRTYVNMVKRNRFSLGLVPTMGAFHEGHLSLIRAARQSCDKVVVSIFLNPTQFGPHEDLDLYPRQIEKDLKLAADAGADLVFAPSAGEMYGPDHRTFVSVEGISGILCGASRPGHFRGVATVVAKLFHLVEPDVAWFGRKDYQQTVVIRRMVRDLDFPVEVRVRPTVREPEGLAMSSRNVYLDLDSRKKALALIHALRSVQEAFAEGETNGEELAARARNMIETTPDLQLEYAVVVHPDTLEAVKTAARGSVCLVAARLGETRLIDNVVLGVPE